MRGGKAGELCLKAHLAAKALYFAPDALNDAAQPVGAHMGLLLPCHLGRRAVRKQCLFYKGAQRVVDARCQLAVGKSARAALAELDVRLRLQSARLLKGRHRSGALFHGGAALQHKGGKARLRQHQRCEQPRGPKPAHHRPFGQRHGAVRNGEGHGPCQRHRGRKALVRELGALVPQLHSHRIDKAGPAVPCVHAHPRHLGPAHAAALYPQHAQRLGQRRLARGRKRKAYLLYKQHLSPPLLRRRCRTAPRSCPWQTPCPSPAPQWWPACSADPSRH